VVARTLLGRGICDWYCDAEYPYHTSSPLFVFNPIAKRKSLMTPRLLLVCVLLLSISSRGSGAATADIVIHASDVSHFTGMSLVSDSTAAGGRKLSTKDAGWASTERPAAASAAPTASFAFDVPETGDYRVWLRLRGRDDSKFNESVWVQFDNASAVYRWGTNSGLLVNLENCSNCGIQGWGWQDNSWWLNQPSVVRLSAGVHYIYVSVREDGVEFDQIVLSPATYFTTAPGPVKNDGTILPKSLIERVTVTSGSWYFDGDTDRGQLDAVGTNGFSLKALVGLETGPAGGVFDSCTSVAGCPPATEQPFHGHWTGSDVISAQVSYRGTQYAVNGSLDDSTIGLLASGFVRMPAASSAGDGAEATASAAFHFGTVFNYAGAPGEPTGRALLVGGGRADFVFSWSTADHAWYLQRAALTFINPSGAATARDLKEIVIYAADAAAISGLTLSADPTAARGLKITSADLGRQWPNAPPDPNTAPYAMYAFDVPAAGNYRVWLRLKGQQNSKWNESVWVQFSSAMRNGAPAYRFGSSDGLLVNLENCSACGVRGWGWQDNAWWLNQSSLVTLHEGMQALYVTVREDGVEFDQIVLSRDRYLSAPPGALKDDQTIVAKPVTFDQVQITNPTFSSFGYDGDVADIEAVGPDLHLHLRFGRLGGAVPLNSVFSCGTTGCAPGALASIEGYWSGEDLGGSALYKGKPYEFTDEMNGGEIQFRGFVRIPRTGAAATVDAPFIFYGTIWYGEDGAPQRLFRYVGGGHASFRLRYEPADGLWYIDTYEFVIDYPAGRS
jgi:hypothetical protein